jgi:7-cyano-7-deazaguanine synthase
MPDSLPNELAVLLSGGLDSAVLLGESLRECDVVHPLYIRSGLFWEAVELKLVEFFLKAMEEPALRPLTILECPVADVYANHWSITGRDVPDEKSQDAAVYMPGRNVFLLSKAMVWCHLNRVPAVALGTLAANPFADATPEFVAQFQAIVNKAIGGSVQILRPYAGLRKVEVVRRGREFPLKLTLSCLRPIGGAHCGKCNKCEERRSAFAEAGLVDRTLYAA